MRHYDQRQRNPGFKPQILKKKPQEDTFFKPFVQAKLNINKPGDRYEQEADRVAEKINAGKNPSIQRSEISSVGIQKKCADCDQEGKKVQKKENGQKEKQASGLVTEVLKSGGNPLDKDVRRFMEPRFGYDFAKVKIHTDVKAGKSAEAIGAKAYTSGRNIVFAPGRYQPQTAKGRKLIAHELTHVVQQNRLKTRRQMIVQRAVQSGTQSVLNKVDPVAGLIDAEQAILGSLIGRTLTMAELGVLYPVFGLSLNYALIRICESSVCSPDGVPRTLGNMILAPKSGIGSELIHECAHVWQHQNGLRWAYIPDALLANFAAWLVTGKRSAAYNWKMYYNNHIPWCLWNAEAQAQYISDNKKLPPAWIWMTGGLLPLP